MDGLVWLLAIVMGGSIGVGLAFLICSLILNASNNKGDSRSKIDDYSSDIFYTNQSKSLRYNRSEFVDIVETGIETLVINNEYDLHLQKSLPFGSKEPVARFIPETAEDGSIIEPVSAPKEPVIFYADLASVTSFKSGITFDIGKSVEASKFGIYHTLSGKDLTANAYNYSSGKGVANVTYGPNGTARPMRASANGAGGMDSMGMDGAGMGGTQVAAATNAGGAGVAGGVVGGGAGVVGSILGGGAMAAAGGMGAVGSAAGLGGKGSAGTAGTVGTAGAGGSRGASAPGASVTPTNATIGAPAYKPSAPYAHPGLQAPVQAEAYSRDGARMTGEIDENERARDLVTPGMAGLGIAGQGAFVEHVAPQAGIQSSISPQQSAWAAARQRNFGVDGGDSVLPSAQFGSGADASSDGLSSGLSTDAGTGAFSAEADASSSMLSDVPNDPNQLFGTASSQYPTGTTYTPSIVSSLPPEQPDEPEEIYEAPTATRPLWDNANADDDFSDFEDFK